MPGDSPFDKLYRPEHIPSKLSLTHGQGSLVEESKTEADIDREEAAVVTNASDALVENKASRSPLSPEEAEIISRLTQKVLSKGDRILSKIDTLEASIDEQLLNAGQNGTELSFELDIKRKPRLREAVKLVFGKKTSTITYSMYKEALRRKKELEDFESKDVFEVD